MATSSWLMGALLGLGLGTGAEAGDKDKTRDVTIRCSTNDGTYAYLFVPALFLWTDDKGERKEDGSLGAELPIMVCNPTNKVVHEVVQVSGKADGAKDQVLSFNVYKYKKAEHPSTNPLDVLKELKKDNVWYWSIRGAKFDRNNNQTNRTQAPDLDEG